MNLDELLPTIPDDAEFDLGDKGKIKGAELKTYFNTQRGTLTAREQQVMEMLSRGLTNREIAEQLQISIKTVDTHRGHVLKKLNLRNNSELTRFAVKHGFVTL